MVSKLLLPSGLFIADVMMIKFTLKLVPKKQRVDLAGRFNKI